MFEPSRYSSVTVSADSRRGGYRLTLGRDGESMALNGRYRTREEALRAGNALLSEWERTGRKPRG